MPRSQRSELVAEIKRLLQGRQIDCGLRFRLWHRENDRAVPGELLPTVYGGIYDRIDRRYIGASARARELPLSVGQRDFVLRSRPGEARCLALGTPGAGKTMALVNLAIRKALENPNRIGGLIGATDQRRRIIWDKLLDLLRPLGWIDEVAESRREITMCNGFVFQVLAAKRQSANQGNPLQGRDWIFAGIDETQNLEEEAQIEIDARGRNAGMGYCVYETATNAPIPAFRERLEIYGQHLDTHSIMRFGKDANPWIDPLYYERMRSLMSEHEYATRIEVRDLAPEDLVYSAFAYATHVRPIPANARDVTRQTIARFAGDHPADYVAATDFGVIVNTTIMLKAFQIPRVDRVAWYAVDEITSWYKTADYHAREILNRYSPEEILVIGDPHLNVSAKDADKSDYDLFRREGLTAKPAVYGRISKKARIAMFNTLLQDAHGKRRFFIKADEHGHPWCKHLARSLLSQSYVNGDPEGHRKNKNDPTHWPSAVQYGLWPFERALAHGHLALVSGDEK